MYYILKERYAAKARLKYKRKSKDPEFREQNRQKQLTYYNTHKHEEWFKRRNVANTRCHNFRKKRARLLLFSAFSAWRSFKFVEECVEVVESQNTDKGFVHFP